MDYGLKSRGDSKLSGLSLPSGRIIDRIRPFSALERELPGFRPQGTVVVLVGPSGAGKTEFVRQLVRRYAFPAIWISFHEIGRSAQGVLDLLIKKVASLVPGLNLRSRLPRNEPRDLSAMLMGRLDVLLDVMILEYGSPFFLVLDNWEEVAESPIHVEIVNRVLERLPQGCCLVLASRSSPVGIRLARMRAESRCVILHAADLFFDEEEIRLLTDRFNLPASAAIEIGKLSGGWPAMAVLLAREYTRGLDTLARSAAQAYLRDEVWYKASPQDKKALLRLSLVAPFDAGLIKVVTGREAQEFLMEKEIFLQEVSEKSFCFSSIWAALLEEEAQTGLTDQEREEVHLRAFEYFLECGAMERAMASLFASGREDRAWEIFKTNVSDWHRESKYELIAETAKVFSAELTRRYPEISFYHGKALFYMGRIPEAVSHLERAVSRMKGRSVSRTECGLLLLEGLLLLDDYERCLYFTKKLAKTAFPLSPLRFRYKLFKAISCSQLGQMNEAERHWSIIDRVAQSPLLPLMPYERVYLRLPKAIFFHLDRSEFSEAEGIINAAISVLKTQDPEHRLAWAYLFKGLILRERFLHREAVGYLKQALRLNRRFNLSFASQAAAFLAFTAAEERMGEAKQLLDEVEDFASFDYSRWTEILSTLAKCYHTGNPALINRLVTDAFNMASASGLTFLKAQAAFTATRFPKAFGQKQVAAMLSSVFEDAERIGMPHRSLRCILHLFDSDPSVLDGLGEEKLRSVLLEAGRKDLGFVMHAVTPQTVDSFLEWCLDRGLWSEVFLQHVPEANTSLAERLISRWDHLPREAREYALQLFEKLRYRPALGPLKRWVRAGEEASPQLLSEATRTIEHLEQAAPLPLFIRFFGGFSLHVGDRVVERWPRQSALDLFKFLAVNRGRPISFERLADIFWPGKSLKRAKSSLWAAASAIRAVLEPELMPREPGRYLRVSGENYLLDLPEESWLDIDEFEELVRRGRSLAGLGSKEEALEAFSKARTLYQGDFLLEDLYKDWTLFYRERFLSKYMEVLEEIGRLCLELGNIWGARDAAEELEALDPFSEDACLLLMKSYFEEGKRLKAIRHFKKFTERLQREFQVSPGSRLQRYYSMISS